MHGYSTFKQLAGIKCASTFILINYQPQLLHIAYTAYGW